MRAGHGNCCRVSRCAYRSKESFAQLERSYGGILKS
jgi:hypothetical protein